MVLKRKKDKCLEKEKLYVDNALTGKFQAKSNMDF